MLHHTVLANLQGAPYAGRKSRPRGWFNEVEWSLMDDNFGFSKPDRFRHTDQKGVFFGLRETRSPESMDSTRTSAIDTWLKDWQLPHWEDTVAAYGLVAYGLVQRLKTTHEPSWAHHRSKAARNVPQVALSPRRPDETNQMFRHASTTKLWDKETPTFGQGSGEVVLAGFPSTPWGGTLTLHLRSQEMGWAGQLCCAGGEGWAGWAWLRRAFSCSFLRLGGTCQSADKKNWCGTALNSCSQRTAFNIFQLSNKKCPAFSIFSSKSRIRSSKFIVR
jgi:hypothetical protein